MVNHIGPPIILWKMLSPINDPTLNRYDTPWKRAYEAILFSCSIRKHGKYTTKLYLTRCVSVILTCSESVFSLSLCSSDDLNTSLYNSAANVYSPACKKQIKLLKIKGKKNHIKWDLLSRICAPCKKCSKQGLYKKLLTGEHNRPLPRGRSIYLKVCWNLKWTAQIFFFYLRTVCYFGH